MPTFVWRMTMWRQCASHNPKKEIIHLKNVEKYYIKIFLDTGAKQAYLATIIENFMI
jgi:hypothetical protein